MVVTYLPGESGQVLRYRYWKKRLRYLGENVKIDEGVYFSNPKYIHIDDNSWIDKNVVIMAGPFNSKRELRTIKNPSYPGEPGVVFIGKHCHIGHSNVLSGISAGLYISDYCATASNCKFYSLTHHYKSFAQPEKIVCTSGQSPAEMQCLMDGAIYLGPNVGMALNCIFLPGVTLPGHNAIHINTTVYKGRYPEYARLQGDPAKVVGDRRGKDIPKES